MQAYYGVSPCRRCRPDSWAILAGLFGRWRRRCLGATAQLTKNFGNGFEAGVYGSYYRLVGDASDSPLTPVSNQFIAGVSLSYTFNMGKSWW